MTVDEPTDGSADGHVVLGGKYVLGDVLGTGGTYTVYEATEIDGGSAPLVIKVLHPHLVDDAVTRAALEREIAASGQVDHPAVVKVLDSGEEEVAGATVPWVLTRRLPGVPLAEAARGHGLPWPEALSVTAGLLEALTAVHAADLVHRDVGPRNVVVDRHDDGTVTVGLLDLGLTAPGGGDGDGDTVAGSVATMSPEQAQGRPLDTRSDLYSAGALTYFALTGHPPFERATAADVLRAHVGAPVPAPSARRPSVPGAVDRFVARAMAKDPARRFDSADAMSAAVATLLGPSVAAAVPAVPAQGADDPDQTMSLGQVADDGTDRTAVVGVAGAAAAGAAAGAAAMADDAELGRTRQIGAVDDVTADDVAVADQPATPDEPAGVVPPTPDGPGTSTDEPSRWRAFWRHPLTVAAITLLLTAGAVGAFLLWGPDGDEAPVAPAPTSASPSPETSRPTSRPSSDATDETTSRPARTSTPTPTPTPTSSPSEEPSEEPSDEPTEEPTEEPTQEPTEEPTEEPTDEPTEEPTQEPEPTEEPTQEPEPTEEPTDEVEPTAEATAPAGSGGNAGSGEAGGSAALQGAKAS